MPPTEVKMPFRIENRGGPRPFKIIKTTTGQIVGTSVTMKNAQTSIRAREREEKRR